jgi:hypothetical protein
VAAERTTIAIIVKVIVICRMASPLSYWTGFPLRAPRNEFWYHTSHSGLSKAQNSKLS